MADTPIPPPFETRFKKPLGVLPKNIQHIAIVGIAMLMVIVIAFSSQTRRPPRPTDSPAENRATDPNETRIREYQEQLDAQVQRLAQEQAKLKAAEAASDGVLLSGAHLVSGPDAGRIYSDPYTGSPNPTPERDWKAVDRERRQESRYAPNVAFTRRKDERQDSVAPALIRPAEGSAEPAPDDSLRQATGPLYRVQAGYVIEAALVNRLDSSFSGPVNCQVTTSVYSHDRSTLLIPQGARLLGTARRVETFGDQRLAVSFERLVMPDGYSAELKALPGLSHVGETGLRDQVDRHFGQIFGVSIAIGAIGGLAQVGASNAPGVSAGDAYRQGVTGSVAQSSLNILDRFLNVLPTFTVREGHRVKVYLTGDLLLPAYDNHRMPRPL